MFHFIQIATYFIAGVLALVIPCVLTLIICRLLPAKDEKQPEYDEEMNIGTLLVQKDFSDMSYNEKQDTGNCD